MFYLNAMAMETSAKHVSGNIYLTSPFWSPLFLVVDIWGFKGLGSPNFVHKVMQQMILKPHM